ncbi:MAG: hypothetical protein C4K49_02260 [Candidatus Thorarchaeota archaeon]|nr:MAG: hypothetical protein C4K49_02260 [Candidatus Thorarchaeota archaeon]
MPDGCTIGAKVVGARALLFKNRDLVYEDFKDSAIFDDTLFAVTGMNIGSGAKAGVSVGFNKWGLAACSSTVLIRPAEAYDFLLEEVLRNARTLDEAYRIVSTSLETGKRYQWCNFVVATPNEVGAIEIGDGVCDIERDPKMITRANHHNKLSTGDVLAKASRQEREAGGPLYTSERRRQTAAKMLESAKSVGDIISIVSTHSPGKGFDSICRHRTRKAGEDKLMGETAYSYIVEMSTGRAGGIEFRMHVARSNPCSNPFKEVLVDFGSSPQEKERVVKGFP